MKRLVPAALAYFVLSCTHTGGTPMEICTCHCGGTKEVVTQTTKGKDNSEASRAESEPQPPPESENLESGKEGNIENTDASAGNEYHDVTQEGVDEIRQSHPCHYDVGTPVDEEVTP